VQLTSWILAWDARSIGTGNLRGLFDANVLYPEPNALAYSEHMLGAQPVFAPLYWITGRLTLANNLFVLSTFILAGLAAYWTALRWLGSHAPALLVGGIYAFAPYRFNELAHEQLLTTQYLPILCYLLWNGAGSRPTQRWIAIAGLALLQSLCSYYVGYQAFVVAGVFLLGASLAAREGRVRRILWGASALLAAAALMALVSLPYLSIQRENPLLEFHLDAAQFIKQAFLPDRADGAGWGAWLLVPAAALYGAWVGIRSQRLRSLTLTLLATIAVLLFLALGRDGEVLGAALGGPYRLLEAIVPGWQAIRVPSRFCAATWLPLSVLVALPLAMRESAPRSSRRMHALAATFALALLAPLSGLEIRTVPAPDRVHDLAPYAWLREGQASGPLLEWPMRWGLRNAESMYLSTYHWLPLVNGYTGSHPPTYALMESLANALPEPSAARTLEVLNTVRWVLVRKEPFDPDALAAWDRLAPAHAQLRFENERSRLYELRFDAARPAAVQGSDPGLTLLGTPRMALDDAALAADLTPIQSELVDVYRLNLPCSVRVRNISSTRWPAVDVESAGLVGVTFRIRRSDDTEFRPWGEVARIAADLGPGEEILVRATVRSPAEPGDYEVVPCLIQIGSERVRCDTRAPVKLRVSVP
jgi:hypothetical protein